jgi:translocon-associated protein (TRAP) delta subunit
VDASGQPFTSVKEPAELVHGELSIDWHVDPNAVRGDAFFTLVVEDPAGGQHPLVSTEGEPLRFNVNIGGEIDVEFTGVSKAEEHSRGTVFAVEFSLSCNDEPLSGAKLSVEVGESTEAIAVAGVGEKYSVSWMVPHHAAPTGDYEVRVFRDVDRARAADIDAARLKAARQEQREKELAGGAVVDDVQIEKTHVDPLFVRSIHHDSLTTFSLPIRTQWLVLFFFGFVFYRVASLSS